MIRRIINARLRGRQGLARIDLNEKGHIAAVADMTPGGHAAGATIDARGGLVLPSFIDLHLHLDLAYSLDLVPENQSGTLVEAIRLYAEAKKGFTPASVCERAVRAIEAEIAFGTGAIRNHVDVGQTAGLRLCEDILAAREQVKDRIDIQVVTFPQDGVLRDPGAIDRMREAMRMGCNLVGGIAHYERTPTDSRRQIELLFDLAEEFDADIDCHIDETDSPESRCVEYLAAETIRRGRQGRVTASHVCALASYEPVHAAKVIGLLAEARVHVVTNPGVNLHLQGRFDTYPKRRGLTRVRELMAAGVNVSAGQDCIKDPFYPFGTGQMLEVAHLLVHADHLSSPALVDKAMDAITVNPARSMHLDNYGLKPGGRGDLVILPVDQVHEAIRCRPMPVAVLKAGRQVGGMDSRRPLPYGRGSDDFPAA
ncbi:MAG TPA: amidohydrolase family protein [Phycisphaerae bacterium]|nr:amidohydrolase family protein [Phycisphaerae bacterium]